MRLVYEAGFKRVKLKAVRFCCGWMADAVAEGQIKVCASALRVVLMPSDQRFKYCPFCGKPIEVKELGEE
jgi:hypothetical protein